MTEWQKFCNQIKKEFENKPNAYLRQRTISKTVHPSQGNLTKRYAEWLQSKRKSTWDTYSQYKDFSTGNPHINYEGMSQSTIQNIYMLSNLEHHLDLKINDLKYITEIGGGYGNLASLARRSGCEADYTIVDFDVMHNMQKHLLSTHDLCYNIHFKSLNDLQNAKGGLMVATFSMNEMPMSDREVIEKSIRNFEYIYIQYNRQIFGYDNYPYFDEFVTRIENDFTITRFDCECYPNHPIIIGKRK